MKKVVLLGDLGEKFGREWNLEVNTPAEAIRAIAYQSIGFASYLNSESGYTVEIDGIPIEEECELECCAIETILISPALEGSGAVGRILTGAVLLASSAFLGFGGVLVGQFGLSMLAGGIIDLFSPQPDNRQSSFASESDRTVQGRPIPVLFGTRFIQPPVISSWVDNLDLNQQPVARLFATQSGNTIQLSWQDPNTDPNNYTVGYQIQWNSPAGTQTANTVNNSYAIVGITGGYTYNIQVRSVGHGTNHGLNPDLGLLATILNLLLINNTGAYSNWIGTSITPVSISTVSVATDPIEVEEGETTGNSTAITFTRSITDSHPLSIGFTVGGTATFNSDYTQSGANSFSSNSGAVIIPASQSSASIVITTIPDNLLEGGETIEIILSSSPTYAVASTDPIIITIVDSLYLVTNTGDHIITSSGDRIKIRI